MLAIDPKQCRRVDPALLTGVELVKTRFQLHAGTPACARPAGHDGDCSGFGFHISRLLTWRNGLPAKVGITDINEVRAAMDATPGNPVVRSLLSDLVKLSEQREAAHD